MSKPLRVVIVGGVAAGPKVASKVIRLCQDAETVPRLGHSQVHSSGPELE